MDIEKFLPENLKNTPLFKQVSDLLKYVVEGFYKEYNAVINKNKPSNLDNEECTNIINELGLSYIDDISKTLESFEKKELLQFIAIINSLKGTRLGLEIVLKILGFNCIITEWWEREPKENPHTYDLIVVLGDVIVPDIYDLFQKLKVFSRYYIYPLVRNLEYKYTLSFAQPEIISYGFYSQIHRGLILQRA